MKLFKRSVISEISSHGAVVVSTILVVWLSVLLVRLLGEAASGNIGAEVVLGLATFSSITALPVILSVSLFIAVLTTVTRSFRESEMVVWFASGISLREWIKPVLYCAIPIGLIVSILTIYTSPWAYRQITEYRERYEQRSEISKITSGQFVEAENGSRVFFAQESDEDTDEMGRVLARVIDPEWTSFITSDKANIEFQENGDKFLVLTDGYRYDLKPGLPNLRIAEFDRYGVRLAQKSSNKEGTVEEQARAKAEGQIKGRPTTLLFTDDTNRSWSQIMWRFALPIAAINLALLAIPLGASNPRLGRSGDILIAGLIGMLYMNLINLSRGWISSGQLNFSIGIWLVHAVFAGLMVFMMWYKLRLKPPKKQKTAITQT